MVGVGQSQLVDEETLKERHSNASNEEVNGSDENVMAVVVVVVMLVVVSGLAAHRRARS